MSSFTDFALATPILNALAGEGYTAPTPIQSQAIPPILAGRDLCGIAQTGTGKTAAFAVPILQRLGEARDPAARGTCHALVLSPTRELASQIAANFRAYGAGLRLSTAVVFGGVPLGPQQRQLARGVDILVATPGRLLDLVDRRAVSLSQLRILVLDEADRMLDLGFIHALRRIVNLVPQQRQTLLFSATMPKSIATLAEQYLNEPVKVMVTPAATTVERVKQSVMFVPGHRKQALLTSLLGNPELDRVLVFARTKHGADRVVRHLASAGIEAAAIHGNKSQPQRERALGNFRSGNARVLVATDIAARGLDVDGVSHVINFELPNVPEDYVHRIGRTARAGADGVAIAFCSDDERPYLRDIEKLTRISVPVVPVSAEMRGPALEPAQRTEPAPQPQPRRASTRNVQGHGKSADPADRVRRRNAVPSRHGEPHAPADRGRSRRDANDNPQRSRTASPDGLPAFLHREPARQPQRREGPRRGATAAAER